MPYLILKQTKATIVFGGCRSLNTGTGADSRKCEEKKKVTGVHCSNFYFLP